MNDRICISKKLVHLSLFIFLILLVVGFSTAALDSNQATKSKASETNASVQIIPTGIPPSAELISSFTQYAATRDKNGNLQLSGKIPNFYEGRVYSIFMQMGTGQIVHVDSFIATNESIHSKFETYWVPNANVTEVDVKTSVFYLIPTK